MDSKILLLISTLALFFYPAHFEIVAVSKKWYQEHGCPKVPFDGPFMLDCNECDSCKNGLPDSGKCTVLTCNTEVIDNYVNGDACKPHVTFFSGCKICKCAESGKNADCEDTACRYYPNSEAQTKVTSVKTPELQTTTNQENVRVSMDWYKKHGCPKKPFPGSLILDCDVCDGCRNGSLNAGGCIFNDCKVDTIDSYKPGDNCTAGAEFYSGCKRCKCDAQGTEAKCDDSACDYYPDVNQNEVTNCTEPEKLTQIPRGAVFGNVNVFGPTNIYINPISELHRASLLKVMKQGVAA